MICHRLSDDVSNDPMLESKHRIFLSHSRFQKEFVEHLCIALESRCRYSFFDIRPSSLPKGERFPKLILEAIEQCELLVVVLSDEYFMSKWPMIELHGFVQAIEAMKHKPSTSRQKLILPLFYKLSVKEFRDETRRKKWFKKWEILAKDDGQRRINVSAWKNALDMLGSYNGISYNEELQGIKAYEDDIVSHICDKITADVKWDDSHVQGKAQIFEVLHKQLYLTCVCV